MARTFTFYFSLKVQELDALVENFQKEFDESLKDLLSDDEISLFEKQIDALGAVYVGPLLSELTFDDLEADPETEKAQRIFFSTCRSSLTLENVPYLETNAFQVSWLRNFLSRFPDFLVDQGGTRKLVNREKFFEELAPLKNMDSFISSSVPIKRPVISSSAPVSPIDFLIMDVYKELARLKENSKMSLALETVAPFEKARRIFSIMKEGKLDADSLLRLSGLNAKDFDDHLEKLKFILKKI